MSRDGRIRQGTDYQWILARGKRHRTAVLDFIWATNDAGHPRLGLVVPKFQSSAVARNRLRRRLKEIWRRGGQQKVGGIDVIIRVRRESYAATMATLGNAVQEWTEMISGSAG